MRSPIRCLLAAYTFFLLPVTGHTAEPGAGGGAKGSRAMDPQQIQTGFSSVIDLARMVAAGEQVRDPRWIAREERPGMIRVFAQDGGTAVNYWFRKDRGALTPAYAIIIDRFFDQKSKSLALRHYLASGALQSVNLQYRKPHGPAGLYWTGIWNAAGSSGKLRGPTWKLMPKQL